MINHWIDRIPPPVEANRRAQTRQYLNNRLDRCQQQRAMAANLIAVDHYDQGALLKVVQERNAVSKP
jgi:hypothetical protein